MKKLYFWLVDYWHILKRSAVMYVFFKPPKHHLDHLVEGKCPVVIIPGILGKWSFMRPIANQISLNGHPTYVVRKLKNNLFNIPLSAKIVSDFLQENDIKDAVVVAHSKGGLIARYLIEYHDDEERIKGVVAIASPFSGSSMAKLVPHKAFLELLPDSVVMKKLQSNKEYNKKIISIIPYYDNHVWAEKGSNLENALDNIEVKVSGHHKILSDKEVMEKVGESIDRF